MGNKNVPKLVQKEVAKNLLNCSPVVEVVEALGPAACELLVRLGQDVLLRLGSQPVEEAEPRRLLLRLGRVALNILQHAHQSLQFIESSSDNFQPV